jgi:Ca2+-binding EF-hand superfamily protein
LDIKKRNLIKHNCFSVETTFLRIINDENNSPEARNNQKFNFEAFRSFLKNIGINSKLIKSLIDLFSSFDIKQECYLGLQELKEMILPLEAVRFSQKFDLSPRTL